MDSEDELEIVFESTSANDDIKKRAPKRLKKPSAKTKGVPRSKSGVQLKSKEKVENSSEDQNNDEDEIQLPDEFDLAAVLLEGDNIESFDENLFNATIELEDQVGEDEEEEEFPDGEHDDVIDDADSAIDEVKCGTCQKSYASNTRLIKHIRRRHGKNPSNSDRESCEDFDVSQEEYSITTVAINSESLKLTFKRAVVRSKPGASKGPSIGAQDFGIVRCGECLDSFAGYLELIDHVHALHLRQNGDDEEDHSDESENQMSDDDLPLSKVRSSDSVRRKMGPASKMKARDTNDESDGVEMIRDLVKNDDNLIRSSPENLPLSVVKTNSNLSPIESSPLGIESTSSVTKSSTPKKHFMSTDKSSKSEKENIGIKCGDCGKRFLVSNDLMEHIQNDHLQEYSSDVEGEPSKIDTTPTGNVAIQATAEIDRSRDGEMDLNLRNCDNSNLDDNDDDDDENVLCRKCQKSFKNQFEMMEHIEQDHLKTLPPKNDKNQNQFEGTERVKDNHLKTPSKNEQGKEMGGGPVRCGKCSQDFSDAQKLLCHIEKDHIETDSRRSRGGSHPVIKIIPSDVTSCSSASQSSPSKCQPPANEDDDCVIVSAIKCGKCGTGFDNHIDLLEHIANDHLNDNDFDAEVETDQKIPSDQSRGSQTAEATPPASKSPIKPDKNCVLPKTGPQRDGGSTRSSRTSSKEPTNNVAPPNKMDDDDDLGGMPTRGAKTSSPEKKSPTKKSQTAAKYQKTPPSKDNNNLSPLKRSTSNSLRRDSNNDKLPKSDNDTCEFKSSKSSGGGGEEEGQKESQLNSAADAMAILGIKPLTDENGLLSEGIKMSKSSKSFNKSSNKTTSESGSVKCGQCSQRFCTYEDLLEHIDDHLQEGIAAKVNGSVVDSDESINTNHELVQPKRKLSQTNSATKKLRPETAEDEPVETCNSPPEPVSHESDGKLKMTNGTFLEVESKCPRRKRKCSSQVSEEEDNKEPEVVHKPVKLMSCRVLLGNWSQTKPVDLQCGSCNEKFSTDQEIFQHVLNRHLGRDSGPEPDSSEARKLNLEKLIAEQTQSVVDLMSLENQKPSEIPKPTVIPPKSSGHPREIGSVLFPKCSQCGDIFIDQYYLTEHSQQVHGTNTSNNPAANKSIIKCRICGDIFLDQGLLDEHIASGHKTSSSSSSAETSTGPPKSDPSNGFESNANHKAANKRRATGRNKSASVRKTSKSAKSNPKTNIGGQNNEAVDTVTNHATSNGLLSDRHKLNANEKTVPGQLTSHRVFDNIKQNQGVSKGLEVNDLNPGKATNTTKVYANLSSLEEHFQKIKKESQAVDQIKDASKFSRGRPTEKPSKTIRSNSKTNRSNSNTRLKMNVDGQAIVLRRCSVVLKPVSASENSDDNLKTKTGQSSGQMCNKDSPEVKLRSRERSKSGDKILNLSKSNDNGVKKSDETKKKEKRKKSFEKEPPRKEPENPKSVNPKSTQRKDFDRGQRLSTDRKRKLSSDETSALPPPPKKPGPACRSSNQGSSTKVHSDVKTLLNSLKEKQVGANSPLIKCGICSEAFAFYGQLIRHMELSH